MLFFFHCIDRADQPGVRAANRQAHLDYLAQHGSKVLLAGPTLGADGTPTGSVLIVGRPDLAAAESFAAADPYAKAGLFGKTTIAPWRKVIFNPGS